MENGIDAKKQMGKDPKIQKEKRMVLETARGEA